MAGGAYYNRVGGRGRGTILRQPDYGSMFAAQAKNLGAIAKQKEDTKLKKQLAAKGQMDDLRDMYVSVRGADQKWMDEEYNGIIERASKKLQEYQDKGMDMPNYEWDQFMMEANSHKQKAFNINKQYDAYAKAGEKNLAALQMQKITPEVYQENVERLKQYMSEDYDTRTAHSPEDNLVYDAPYDLRMEYAKQFKKYISPSGQGSISQLPGGKYEITNVTEVTQDDVNRFNKGSIYDPDLMEHAAEQWKENPQIQADFPGGPADYLKSIGEAMVYSRKTKGVAGGGGVGISIKMPEKATDEGFEDATYRVGIGKDPLGNMIYGDFAAKNIPTNQYSKQTGTGTSQFTMNLKTNLPYYTASGKRASDYAAGQLFIGPGDAYLAHIADKDVDLGGGRIIKKGYPILSEWEKDYSNKGGTFHYETWMQAGMYNGQAGGTFLDNVYYPLNGYETNINNAYDQFPVMSPDLYKKYGSLSNYLKHMEKEFNSENGNNGGQPSGGSSSGGSKPTFTEWQKSNPGGTYAKYKQQFP